MNQDSRVRGYGETGPGMGRRKSQQHAEVCTTGPGRIERGIWLPADKAEPKWKALQNRGAASNSSCGD